MNVGHVVSRDLVRYELAGEGLVADVGPDAPFVLRHTLLLQGEVVASAFDVGVVDGGPVSVEVVATPAGGSAATYLDGPRVPYDGHNRHGTFDLTTFGTRSVEYTAGGPPAAVALGARSPSPRNVDPNDPGRDYGDYGVVQRITFVATNPNPAPQLMYLYAKPLGGPARGTYVVDGTLRELGCTRLAQPYWVATYQLAPGMKAASTTVTMTDGGSFFPVEYGVTSVAPQPYAPPVGAPDGCSPSASPPVDRLTRP